MKFVELLPDSESNLIKLGQRRLESRDRTSEDEWDCSAEFFSKERLSIRGQSGALTRIVLVACNGSPRVGFEGVAFEQSPTMGVEVYVFNRS